MTSESAIPADFEALVRAAVRPSGDSASLRQREAAAIQLVAMGPAAHDRLIRRVEEHPEAIEAPLLIELVGRFGSEASAEPLKRLLLDGKAGTSRAAGRALAAVDAPATLRALEEGLRSDDVEVRIAAVDAVRLTGDTEWCGSLQPALEDPDANLRYYAVNAAAELGCLDADHLDDIARQDADEHVRELASKWTARGG